MLRLAGTLYSLIATTLAGSAVVAALTMGVDTWQSLALFAGLGGLLALPASYFVAQAIIKNG